MIVLAVLGGLGIVAFLWSGAQMALDQRESMPFIVGLVFLLIVLAIALVVALVQTRHHPEERTFGRIFVRILSATGGIVAVLGLLGLAIVAFFFVVCMASLGK